MVGRVITASSGQSDRMHRRAADGSLVAEHNDRGVYVSPPIGSRCRLKISGISDDFTFANSEWGDEGAQGPRVRVEYEILNGDRGTKPMIGRRFSEVYPLKTSAGTKLGNLIGALRGWEVGPGEGVRIDEIIGSSFNTTITASKQKGYPILGAIELDGRDNPYITAKPPADLALAGADDAFDLNEPSF